MDAREFVCAYACSVALLAACSSGMTTRDANVERVADGVYALRLPARALADETIVPARVSFVVGPGGVVVIDSGLAYDDGRAILEAVERTAHAPVRLAILTQPTQEAIFGAAAYQERGVPVAMHADAARLMASRCETCLERLRGALGARAMHGSRVIVPDRLLHDGEVIDAIARPLRVVAPGWTSAPGAVALVDERTDTLIAGSIVSIDAVPDLRDADVARWRAVLERLARSHCRHLVPSHGPVGSCADIPRLAAYLDALEARVAVLFARGVELGDLAAACDLPGYASWERYNDLHRANASRTYLRLEREAFGRP
jgi:glyoxylase-like metal-dependent hydrolase (beta-lactamase superfamily II)